MRESSTIFFLTHINLSKLVILLTYALFFHSLHIVPLAHLLLLFITLVVLLSRLVSKLQTDPSIILLLFCGTVCRDCRLIYVTLLITSLLHLHYTHLSLIFQHVLSQIGEKNRSWADGGLGDPAGDADRVGLQL